MNPVPVMTLVEIIKGLATSAETLDVTIQLATAMGKTTTQAHDVPGFIANRSYSLLITRPPLPLPLLLLLLLFDTHSSIQFLVQCLKRCFFWFSLLMPYINEAIFALYEVAFSSLLLSLEIIDCVALSLFTHHFVSNNINTKQFSNFAFILLLVNSL
jgi:hypothetical protein